MNWFAGDLLINPVFGMMRWGDCWEKHKEKRKPNEK